MLYSNSTGGFYATQLHGDNIPADAVEITNDEYGALLGGQSQGKRIVADKDGRPVLADPPAPLLADLKSVSITQVRAMRTSVFATLAGIQSQALANADTVTAKAISGLQDQLKALPDLDLSLCKTQADIDAAFVAGWMAIVAAAPANVASAFSGLVSL